MEKMTEHDARKLYELLIKLGVLNATSKENLKLFIDNWPKDTSFDKWLEVFESYFPSKKDDLKNSKI